MSIYHSDKCTKLEAYHFGREVYQWLTDHGFDLSGLKIRTLTCYNGDFRIYQGHFESENKRSSFRKEKPKLDENGDVIGWNGTRGHHTQKIAQYISINRDEWEDIKKGFNEKDIFWNDLIFKNLPKNL